MLEPLNVALTVAVYIFYPNSTKPTETTCQMPFLLLPHFSTAIVSLKRQYREKRNRKSQQSVISMKIIIKQRDRYKFKRS